LTLMKKGVTVAQVARVANGFTRAGIMVHAYLMYGFPTQTTQETIDALEMVRQLFLNEALQSGFWHRFAMTAHSPVGLNPALFQVQRTGPVFGGFADNDLYHDDPKGADHDLFADGLSKSLFNFMHGIGLDFPLKQWFDFKVPKTAIAATYIEQCLNETNTGSLKENTAVVWLGSGPLINFFQAKQGKSFVEMAELEFCDKRKDWHLHLPAENGRWLSEMFSKLTIGKHPLMQYNDLKKSYNEAGIGNFDEFRNSAQFLQLRDNGLLFL